VNHDAVSPEYFAAMGIPLKRGRVFTKEDRAGAPRVTVVNESFAARFFPGEDAIGKRILTVATQPFREIVGIVGDTKQYGLSEKDMEQVYEPIDQSPSPFMTYIVKTSTEPMLLARSIEKRIQNVDREQALSALRPLRQFVEESTKPSRAMMISLAAFAGVALLIASTGLYGVISYSVSQRTREIGLRMALGAPRTHLLKLILREGVFITFAGLVVGVAGAVGLTRLLQTWLFETSATDLATYVGISAVLASVSLLACYVPARRALSVDPVVALRNE
jgi:putative ABC transport system permease protein